MPMQRELYPDNWEAIALDVKTASDWHCEGCGKPCRRPGEALVTHKNTLTVAHINHTPADCRRSNLIALCAPCHLRYDAPAKRLRAITRKRDQMKKTNTASPVGTSYRVDAHTNGILIDIAEKHGLDSPAAALRRAITLLKLVTDADTAGGETQIKAEPLAEFRNVELGASDG